MSKYILYGGLITAAIFLINVSYFVTHPPHEQCAGVKAYIGMTREELISVCGKPIRINSDVGKSLTEVYKSEQFVYFHWPSDFVYVRDGIVDSMQFEEK